MCTASGLTSTTGTITQEGEAVANTSYDQIFTVQCNQKRSTWCHYTISLLSSFREGIEERTRSRLSPYLFSGLFEGRGTTDDNQQLPSCMGSTQFLI